MKAQSGSRWRGAVGVGGVAALCMAGFVAPAAHAESPDVSVTWDIVQDWGSGYQVGVKVTNNTDSPIEPWAVRFAYDAQVNSIWEAGKEPVDGGFRATAPTWAGALAPGQSASFGLIATASAGTSKTPEACVVADLTCAINDGQATEAPAPTPEPTVPAEESVPADPSEPDQPPVAPSDSVLAIEVAAASDWGTGRTMNLKVTNSSADTVEDWEVSLPWTGSVSGMWNAEGGVKDGVLTARNTSWNGRLEPGQTVNVGFGDTGTLTAPTSCEATVGGKVVPCAVTDTTHTDPVEPVDPTPAPSASATPADPSPDPVEPSDPNYTPDGPANLGERKVIGYYPAWGTYARNYQVADIPGEKVSHINYAFANIAGGKCVLGDSYADIDKAFAGDTWDTGVLRGNFNQLIKLREKNPHLQTLISIGGWTWSSNFSEVAATPQSRKAFVDSCVDFMEQYKFDGIDVDWEYPVGGGLYPGKAEDKANYTLLMQDFREALDAEEANDGRDYWLSIAAPAGPSTVNNLEVGKLADTMDWINLMSYDFHGGWDKVTGHNAPMVRSEGDPAPAGLSITEAVDTYLSRGVPAEKLVLGVPFYGRGWNTDGTTAAGLFQSGKGTALGTWEAASFDYTDLVKNYLPTMTRYWDEEAQVPYLFDPQRKLFITYDDPQSMQVKADYINELGLGGAMFWELSGDRDEELLDALNATLD